jgi:hypothetical protein
MTLRRVLAVIAVLFIVGLGISTVYRAGPYSIGRKRWGSSKHRCDLTVDTAAGRAVLEGTDIYQAHNVRNWYYIYPPLFAIVMVPFAALPTFWASLTWYVLSLFFVSWTLKLSVSVVRDIPDVPRNDLMVCALPPLLVLLPLMSALARGQTTPLLLWLVTAGLVYAWTGHEVRGAICFAGGILLKVFPAVLLAYFVWRRRWRFVITTLLAVAIGAFIIPAAVFGWQRNLNYLRQWVNVIGKPAIEAESEKADNPLYAQLLSAQLPRNQSLAAVLTRLTGNERSRWAAVVIGLAMAAAMLIIGWRRNDKTEIFILSAVVVWMLLIPPVSWSHYFMLLLLPLAVLVVVAFDTEPASRSVARLALGAFAVLALGFASRRLLLFYGPLCWATLGLWFALLFCAWRTRRN